ncbi:MAG TPA: hypothetical protein VFS67_22380 [Polyangiaceae bacterium]|jgi:hypothetical protein|nr:hypothetical protein [Polyangiaceae bacterium]
MAGRIRVEVELAPTELAQFSRVEPPAFLDALVKQRMGTVLERRRAELAESMPAAPPATEAAAPIASKLSGAEACSYAFGLLASGIQLADGVARLIWHAIAG